MEIDKNLLSDYHRYLDKATSLNVSKVIIKIKELQNYMSFFNESNGIEVLPIKSAIKEALTYLPELETEVFKKGKLRDDGVAKYKYLIGIITSRLKTMSI